MTDIERSRTILSLWGDINHRHKQIEDLQLKIGKLKDEILDIQQEIIKVQEADTSRTGPYNLPSRYWYLIILI